MTNIDPRPLFAPTDNPYRAITYHSINNWFSVNVGKTRFCSSLTEAMRVRDEMEGQTE